MSENLKVFFGIATFFICISIISITFDYLTQRAARRQFYRDLVRLVMLYEKINLVECTNNIPKILGPRIIHFASYEAVINVMYNAYTACLTNYDSLLDYVLSLHKSYCFSNRDLIKFKNKLVKETTQDNG